MSFDSKFIADFLSKLNHPLEEVRFRALKNIYNKIERGIISIDDLCQYKEFIPYLLEWFNYDSVSHHCIVFKLLEMASKIEKIGYYMIKIGGIEFLTQLKANSKTLDMQILDNVIDNLLKLNPIEKSFENNERISYAHISKVNQQIELKSQMNDHHQTIGYFNSSSSAEADKAQNVGKNDLKDLEQNYVMKLSIHPIIPLTIADKKVLSGSLSTLRSDDFRIVISGIQFFTDVILEDFPPPVFLQRQGVLRILLQFICQRQYSTAAVKAALKLCLKMRQYIQICLDPNFFSTKNTFGIIKQIPDECEDEYHWIPDELLDFQYEPNMAMPLQLPVPVFSLQIIKVCLHQISEIDKDSNWGDLFQLICTAFQLFRESLGGDLRLPYLLDLWNLDELLNEVFNSWSQLLSQYATVEEIESHQLSNNREIYMGLFSIFWDLVSSLYSPEMALKYLSDSTKTELCRAQFDKCLLLALGDRAVHLIEYVELFDQTLAKINTESNRLMESSKSLIQFFLNNNEPVKYAEQCVAAAEESLDCLEYFHGIKFCKEFTQFFSLICSTEMFTDREDLFVKCEDILQDLMKSQNAGIAKSVFMEIFDIINKCINIEELSKPNVGSERKINFVLRTNIFRSLILYGLHHKSTEIQDTCIALFCRIWDSQGMLSSSSWRKVMNITWEHMIFLHPLTNMDTRIGRQILQMALITCPHIVEHGTDKSSNLSRNSTDNIVDVLPLLYNRNQDVRKEVMQHLEQYFHAGRIWDCQVNLGNMADLLVSSANDNRHERWFTTRSHNHEKPSDVENFKKVFDIYLSESVDISVRKSAAEQLGIFLQIPNMDNYFTSNGGLNYVLDLLKGKILDKNHMTILVPSTVLILLRIVQHMKEIRENLGRDSFLIHNLFQMALYFCYDKQCVADISTILALVVFNPVLKQNKSSSDMSMPEILIDQLSLPFRCAKYSVTETLKSVLMISNLENISNQKWNYQKNFDRNLRIHWNLIKHGGLENYLAYKYSFFGKKILSTDDNFELIDEILPSSQKLSEADVHILNHSIPHLIFCDNLHKIDNATNHCQVQSSLISIELILILCKNNLLSLNIYEILNDPALWISALKRFLLNIPSCSADYILLEFVMDVLENIMNLPLTNRMDNFIKWIVQIITTLNNSLIYCLQKGDKLIGKTDSRRLTLAKNTIESRLPRFFVLLLRYLNLNERDLSSDNTELRIDIISIHKIVFELTQERLKQYVNAPFDNLSMLINCVNLMSVSLEMKNNFFGENVLSILSNCASFCGELIIKFQNNREESSITFMGSGVIHYLLRILIECVCNPPDFEVNASIEAAVCQTNWLRKSAWLLELIGYRSVNIRAMSVALINRLVQFDQPRNILFRHCSNILPESLWSVALTLYLDTSEAPIVRSEAIAILQNLMSKLPLQNSLEIEFNDNNQYSIDQCTPTFIDQDSSIQYTGIEGFYKQLLYKDFFRNVGLAVTNFYTLPFINCSHLKHRPLYDPEYRESLACDFSMSPNVNYVLNQMKSDRVLNVSTPLMISSLMSFLCNLCYYLPNQIIDQLNKLRINTIIMNIFDPPILTLYLKSSHKQHYSTTVDLILAFMNCIKLIRLQINLNSNLRDSFLIDEKFIETIMQLFVATGSGSDASNCRNTWLIMLDLRMAISQLRTEMIYLLIGLVIPMPTKTHVQLMQAHVASQSLGIFSCIKDMIESDISYMFNSPEFLKFVLSSFSSHERIGKSSITAMYFISVYSSLNFNESKSNPLITCLENQKFPESDLFIIEDIANLLLKKRENLSGVTSKSKLNTDRNINERINVHNTLTILLGVSKAAKSYLLRVGFIESALTEIKYLHNKLDHCAQTNIDPCSRSTKSNDNKNSTWKQVMKELISVLELLQNLFYADVNAQTIAASSGFPGIAYRLWTVALVDSDLLHNLLKCFINFSADTVKTAKAIVTCHQTHLLISQPPSVGSCQSVIENICRLTSADINAIHLRETTVKLIFRLLSNLVWCPEGVNLLLRTRFLDKFEQMNPNQLQKSSAGISIQHLWLGLLTNLSFTEEGQNAIMKCNGSGIMRVLSTQNNMTVFRATTLLIIRNLCTHPVIKVKLVVDGSNLIENINQCLDSDNLYIRQLALSTLKALLYSNNKIRVYLKSANLTSKLSNLREIYEHDSKNSLLSDIISLLNAFQDKQEFRTQ